MRPLFAVVCIASGIAAGSSAAAQVLPVLPDRAPGPVPALAPNAIASIESASVTLVGAPASEISVAFAGPAASARVAKLAAAREKLALCTPLVDLTGGTIGRDAPARSRTRRLET